MAASVGYFIEYIMMHGTINIKFYAFFWVNLRVLNFIFRRFGTLSLFHLHRRVSAE